MHVVVRADGNVLVFGIERNKSVAAVFFEKSLAVDGEYAKLALAYLLRLLDKQDVAVMIFRHHTVARYAHGKVRRVCDRI